MITLNNSKAGQRTCFFILIVFAFSTILYFSEGEFYKNHKKTWSAIYTNELTISDDCDTIQRVKVRKDFQLKL